MQKNSTNVESVDQRVKVFPLHVGDTKIPIGQFYARGLQGINYRDEWFRFLTLRGVKYMIAPIYVYLIDHPKNGITLVDTGINREQAYEHEKYYKQSRALSLLLDKDEYLITSEQELPAQLERLGYGINEVKTIIMTHLHEDHVGGLCYFEKAKVVVAEQEYESYRDNIKTFFFFPVVYRPSVSMVSDWQLVNYTSGAYHSFKSSQDVFGDGSLVMLPTPGHSPGHSSVIVEMDGYRLLIVGDIIYTLQHLDFGKVRQIILNGRGMGEKGVRQSIHSIVKLMVDLSDTVILPIHEVTRYRVDYIDSYFKDGVLSGDEVRSIETYYKSIFDENWHLRSSSLPRYVPPSGSEQQGRIE